MKMLMVMILMILYLFFWFQYADVGRWHQITFVFYPYLGEYHYYLYADGVNVYSDSRLERPINTMTSLTLGYKEGLQEDYYFSGHLDEVMQAERERERERERVRESERESERE